MLTTPHTIRTLQRKLYAKAKQETVFCYALNVRVRKRDILSRAGKHRTGKCACLGMKNIGKPCAGKLQARFDEGEQVKLTMARLVRHRHTKGAVNGYAKPTAQLNLFPTLPKVLR